MLVRKIKEKGKKAPSLLHFWGEIHRFLWFVPELWKVCFAKEVEKNGVFTSCWGLCSYLFPAVREGKQWSQKNDTSFCAKQHVILCKTSRRF